MKAFVRRLDSAFTALGFEVRRARGRDRGEPPPLMDDPLEALHLALGGGEAALLCPLDRCVAYNGFGYGVGSWHPFVATIVEAAREPGRAYEGSALEHYFSAWQPADAADALIGCEGNERLRALPSHAFLLPWVSITPGERLEAVESIVLSENRHHAGKNLPVSEGYNQHGPVSPEKGRIEHARLVACHRSLAESGWDRSRGDADVTILRRGAEIGYLIMHGHHRAAAASALGMDSIPARLAVPPIVRREDAGLWPQVRRGLWTEEMSIGYLDHLFDFDARAWAAARSLTRPHGTVSGS